MFELRLTSLRLLVSFMAVLLSLKCKGTREYILEQPSLPLARVTAGVRECGAIYGLFCLGKCALVAWDCGVIARLEPVVRVKHFLSALVCDLTSDPSHFRMRCFLLRFTFHFCTCIRRTLEVCRLNSVYWDSLHLAFYEDFHNSLAPGDDLIRSIVRGGQRRCNCNSLQKYMRACFKFLILEHIFLYGIAQWAQS